MKQNFPIRESHNGKLDKGLDEAAEKRLDCCQHEEQLGEHLAARAEMNSGISDHVRLKEISEEVKTLTETLEQKSMRWLELAEKM